MGKARDHLAKVAVVVDNLCDGQPPLEEIGTVLTRAELDFFVVDGAVRRCPPQRFAKLIQEHRKPLRQLYVRRRRRVSSRDAGARAGENLFPVRRNELAQHAP
jgi:hypothetical protein